MNDMNNLYKNLFYRAAALIAVTVVLLSGRSDVNKEYPVDGNHSGWFVGYPWCVVSASVKEYRGDENERRT